MRLQVDCLPTSPLTLHCAIVIFGSDGDGVPREPPASYEILGLMTPTAKQAVGICPPQGGFSLALRHRGLDRWAFSLCLSAAVSVPLFATASILPSRGCWARPFPMRRCSKTSQGSIVMGCLVAYFAFKSGIPHHWQLFLTTGILGGYTTFSTFSLDVALLYERGELGLAVTLCAALGRAFDCRTVRRYRAGAPFRLPAVTPSAACRACRAAPCRDRGRD